MIAAMTRSLSIKSRGSFDNEHLEPPEDNSSHIFERRGCRRGELFKPQDLWQSASSLSRSSTAYSRDAPNPKIVLTVDHSERRQVPPQRFESTAVIETDQIVPRDGLADRYYGRRRLDDRRSNLAVREPLQGRMQPFKQTGQIGPLAT